MNICKSCLMAGDLLTIFRENHMKISRLRHRRLKALHDVCVGRNSCFCQCRVPDVE